jgi:hypothetical protein
MHLYIISDKAVRSSRCSHLIPRGINLSSDDGDVVLLENAWHKEATGGVISDYLHHPSLT